jgi:hypothetical protein
MATNEPQQLQDNQQLVGDQQIASTGVFEQESVTAGKYNYISTGTTTVVKSGQGVLVAIVVGKSTTGTITVYDNTAGSGTIITAFGTSTGAFAFQIGAIFNTGCTVVTSASDQVTVVYL